jgi:cell division protein FtsB
MSPEIAQSAKRNKTLLLASGMALTIGWAAYNGTRSFDQLMEKQRQIRELQEQNTILQRENEQRKLRIERLSGNSSEQDVEIRKLNLAKPGEIMFMLPEGKKNTTEPTPAPAER